MNAEYIKMGKKGTLVIPASLRHHFGFHDGDMIIAEDHGDGVLLKPTVTLPIEIYSDERKAEFLLSNAITDEGYEKAKKEVVAMGLNPKDIVHYKYPKKDKSKSRSNNPAADKSHD
jgi:AbrB family looped-hinge helix DNA binding protein